MAESSTERVRRLRRRLRKEGYVPIDVWALPEHVPLFKGLEKALQGRPVPGAKKD